VVLAVNAVDVLAGIISIQAGVILGIVILLGRTREKLIKLEEWQRMAEKRWNGKP
jgi:hypothetical protein